VLRLALASLLSLTPVLAAAQERPRPEAEANDLWTELEPGVRYLDRRTSTPTHLHALVIDRAVSGVSVVATPYEERWQTVSDFAAGIPSDRLLAATNGGFWTSIGQAPLGITCSGGEHWPNAAPDPEVGTFWIDEDGVPHIAGPEVVWDEDALGRVVEAVGGRPVLVEAGEVALGTLDTFPTANDRAPRTAIGIGRRARTLILVVVDGRQPASRGMTLYELARLLIELGAETGINLDGGGSSAMVVPDLGGVVNVPARGRWEALVEDGLAELSRLDRTREVDGATELWVHGREREVMSHLALLRRPRASAITGPEADLVPGLAPPLGAPPPLRPGLIRLAILREWLVPLGYVAGLVVAIVLVLRLAAALARRVSRSLVV
jgi:hypothetical protein